MRARPHAPHRASQARASAPAGPVAFLVVPVGVGGLGLDELGALLEKVMVGGLRKAGGRATQRARRAAAPAKPKPRPPGERREWADWPPASRLRAEKRRNVLAAYFAARADGATPGEAALTARQLSLKEFGAAISRRCLDRWRKRVEAAGGMEKAKLETFLDSRSCPHFKARKPRP